MDRDKYFEISKFLKKASELEWPDLIDYCNKDLQRTETVLSKLRKYDPDEETIQAYYNFVHKSTYYFTMGGVPIGMKKEDFQRLKPVVEHLVAKGNWKADSINAFE